MGCVCVCRRVRVGRASGRCVEVVVFRGDVEVCGDGRTARMTGEGGRMK
jgi:hypothetical protein